MKCPNCEGYNHKIVDSRASDFTVKRRRLCLDCGHKYNTYEVSEENLTKMLDTILDIIPDRILQKKF